MKRERKIKAYPHVVGAIFLLGVYALTLLAGYGLSLLIFRLTGRPSDIWAYLLAGVLGGGVIVLLSRVASLIAGHDRKNRGGAMQRMMTDALAQISQGNFDVLLDINDRHVHRELATAINDMAKNLGSLETMRQDFISNVSHEIQSPLTSIGGFASLLKREDLPLEQRQRYAEIIEAESRRLSSLSENLLKLSSLDHNKLSLGKTQFRLDRQLETVALTLEPQWSAKGIALEADLEPCSFYGDGDLLQQVWMNLLNNAMKFTGEDGRIVIRLTQDQDGATVQIADTGIGIAAEDQVHIFERFYKVDKARDRSTGGNGLGLSLVKKIVELHEGQVSVRSQVGQGTSFAVFLPRLHAV